MIQDRPFPPPSPARPAPGHGAARPLTSRVPYLPGLDGMRALAVVAVMLYHTNNGWVPGGFIGVEVFFVISGYLITLLLIGEHERSDRIDLKQFWLRRARRLLPALYLAIALLMVYCSLFEREQLGNLRGDVIAGLTYVSNWYQIWVGQGYTSQLDFVPLRHLWSLAVEEQFYLVWPLVMVGVLRLGRRRLPNVALWLAGIAVAIAAVTAVLYSGATPDQAAAHWTIGARQISRNDTLYLSTITRASGLLIGAAFAMLWRPVAVVRGPLRDRGRQLDAVAAVGLVGLAVLAWKLHVALDDGSGDPWLFRGGFLAVALLTVMMMAAVTHSGAAAGPLLGNPVFVWIGTRSYGLYLFHWPIYQILRGQSGDRLETGQFVLAMALTAAITEASYRFVETPVRKRQVVGWWHRLRDRSTPPERTAVGLTAAAAVALVAFAAFGVATGDLHQNSVEVIIAEGQGNASSNDQVLEILNGTTVPGTAAPATTVDPAVDPGVTTAPPAGATVAPVTAAPTPPAAGGPMIAIGDSVMLGAAQDLKGIGFAEVAAQEGRQFSSEVGFAQQLGTSATLPSVVLVHLGYNGTISQSDADAFFGALQNVPLVVVMTIWGPQKDYVGPNNELLAGLPARFPNVRIAPWADVAPNCDTWAAERGYQHPCYAVEDGYHLGANGAEYYALQVQTWLTQFKAEVGLA